MGKTPTAIARNSHEREDDQNLSERILEKMNMSNNAELTHYAIQNQLV